MCATNQNIFKHQSKHHESATHETNTQRLISQVFGAFSEKYKSGFVFKRKSNI